MSGYLGEGYGMHRDHGDDDFDQGRRLRSEGQDRGALFGGEGRDPRAREAAGNWQRQFGREGHEGSYSRHFHDPSYHSFRERHLAELDRDYDEWCREREQAFHRDFDDFRSRRRQGDQSSGLQPGMLMTNDPGDSSTLAEDHAADSLVAAGEEGAPSRSRRRTR